MKLVSSLFVLAVMVAQCVAYVAAIRKKKGTSPALSTWIIFFIGTALSMATYILSKKKDFLSGVMILMDILNVAVILIAIFAWGDRAVRFRPFEKWYVTGCVAVVGYGLATGDAFGSNLFAQVIICAGYLPTYQKLIREKVNSESYHAWGIGLLSGVAGLVPSLLGHDILATIYASRIFAFTLLVLFLMAICDIRQARRRTS